MKRPALYQMEKPKETRVFQYCLGVLDSAALMLNEFGEEPGVMDLIKCLLAELIHKEKITKKELVWMAERFAAADFRSIIEEIKP